VSVFDKAKAAAAKVAAGAQKGASQVQGKVEQAQTRKKADDLAKQLGYLIVRERTQGEPAGTAADDLVSQIAALEAQLGAEAEAPAAGGSPVAGETAGGEAPPTSASEPTSGDFTLE
jgi:hypothetical protein